MAEQKSRETVAARRTRKGAESYKAGLINDLGADYATYAYTYVVEGPDADGMWLVVAVER